MNFKNLIYALTCLCFSIILGAAIYEHIAVWPAAFAEPPKSLTMFQSAYKLNAAPFWMFIHPITLLLFIVTLILSWKSKRRKYVFIPMIIYIIILIATFSFFVPQLTSIVNTAYSETVDKNLQNQGNMWIILSIIRALILFALAITLFFGLTKHEAAIANNKV